MTQTESLVPTFPRALARNVLVNGQMTYLLAALVAGLVGSPHCVGMCGPFAASCARSPLDATAWHVGRLGTYATLGAVAGAFGWVLSPLGWVLPVVAGALTVAFAASLAGLVPPVHVEIPGLSHLAAAALRRADALGGLVLGAASGLLPCGLVYAALAVPVGLAQPHLGAAAMVAFGLGTVPLLAGASAGLRRVTASRPWARRALAALVLGSGMWSLSMRQPAAEAELGAEAPVCH